MFVSVNKLSHELNLPASWLKSEARAGRIPSLKVGRRLLFDPAQVGQALSARAADSRAGFGIDKQETPRRRAPAGRNGDENHK
jgi:hypothetical protein